MLIRKRHVSKLLTKVAILLLSSAAMQSCKMSKVVPDGKYLLQKNKVKGNELVSKGSVLDQVNHRPNRKLLFFKFHLWAYRSGFKKIGEPPVILDSNLIEKSAKNISVYLFKKGFFYNDVGYTVKTRKHGKKAKVFYQVKEGPQFKIHSVEYRSINRSIQHILDSTRSASLIKKNNALDYDVLARERSRINDLMRENGYFIFNRSLIDYELDTTVTTNQVEVLVNILEDQRRKQHVYRIGRVLTEVETGMNIPDTVKSATAAYIMNGMRLNTNVLRRSTQLRKGEIFRQKNVSNTYERLISLDLFQSVDVRLTPREGTDSTLIDVYIRLVAAPRHDLIWEPQLVTTEQRFNEEISTRNYGLANEITLKNKNVFHNGEEFNVRLRTALETQFARDSNSLFSTFIQEVNTELKVPDLLFLPNLGNKVNSRTNSTRMSLSYLYERNQFYNRHLLPLTYSYEFVQKNATYYWTPMLISLNKASFHPDVLGELNEDYLEAQKRLFTNNLITSHRFSGVVTNRAKSPNNFYYLNSNFIELAGVFLPQITDYGDKLGVSHSTFVRTDIDVRYNTKVGAGQTMVYRFYGGIGVPIGDRSIIPFERRFFAGGSNRLRAWRLRTVGPGGFSNDSSAIQFSRSGDLGIAGNIEYRFDIIDAAVDLEGALFADAGNVWNLKKDTLFPEGDFDFSKFYNQFAVNTGFGLRVDFDFLLVRLDLGLPIIDPNEPAGKRWVFVDPWRTSWFREHAVWNLAVGYPF